jgi:hypothetical protein
MANVFVAFLSFLADDFSRFLRLALFTLYMVNRAAAVAFRSFLDPVDLSRPDPVFIVDTTVLEKAYNIHGSTLQPLQTRGGPTTRRDQKTLRKQNCRKCGR